jgi:mono/diheme cytochrome c family protein
VYKPIQAAAIICLLAAGSAGQEVNVAPLPDRASQLPALMEEGQLVFGTECVTCHAPDGGEDLGPALSSSPSIASADAVVTRILQGVKDMPAFAPTLSDRKVAAVATFVRNAWGNTHGVVLEVEVARVRTTLPKTTPSRP